MRTPDSPAPRTEGDLREALATLERHAPDPDAVLRAVRGQATRRTPARVWWAPRWLGRPRLAFGIGAVATVAAAAGLGTALLVGGTSPPHGVVLPLPVPPGGTGGTHPMPPLSQAGLPSFQAVGRSMLTAYNTADDKVLYTTETGFTRGVVVDIYQDWSWPAQPVTGQREIWRERVAARAGRDSPLLLSEDDSFDYTATTPSTYKARGTLTVVCYPTPGSQGGCGYNYTNTPAGTWSQHVGLFPDPHPELGDLSPASLAHEIARGEWKVTRRTWLNGQRAILLTETAKGSYLPLPTLLWVNERTFLPLRMINGQGRKMWAQDDWHYLAPTKQNLANLQVPIPPGYPRSKG